MNNPLLSILQGEPLDQEQPQTAPVSSRAAVAGAPTLGGMGGRPVPPGADQGAAEMGGAPVTPSGRAMAQQGAQVAQAPPKFRLPPVDEMVSDYQRWQMMASDPEVMKQVKPRLEAWKNLAIQQHAASFAGDPTASPEQAAAYASHMGQIHGRLGAPMKWEEAAQIAEYTEGRKAKMPARFLEGMNSYDKTLVQPLVDDVFGEGWKLVSLAPGKTRIGDSEMEVPTLTVHNPTTGDTKAVTPIEAAALFGNLKGRLEITKLNQEQDLKAARADLEMAKARQDPEAAYRAWEKMQELQGGMGGFGGGKPVGTKAMTYLPTVQAALQETQSPLDPLFVMSIINAESNGNPQAVSPKGASGVMQLMPGTARRFEVADPTNPDQAILGGVKYLNWLHDRYNGDLKKVAAGYNAGEGAVDKYGGVPPYAETKGYVKKVLGTYNTHKAKPGDDATSIGQRLIGMPTAGGATAGTATAAGMPGEATTAALATHEKTVNKMYEKAAGDAAKMDVIAAFDRRKRAELSGAGSVAPELGLGSDWETPEGAEAGGLPLPTRFGGRGAGGASVTTGQAPATGEEALKSQAMAVEQEQTSLAKTKADAESNQTLWDQVQERGGKYDPGFFGKRTGPASVAEAKQDLEFLVAQYANLKPKQQETVKQYLRKIVIQYPELRPK